MTDFEHKYEVELKSAIFKGFDAKYAKTSIAGIKRNVAANESITSKIYSH